MGGGGGVVGGGKPAAAMVAVEFIFSALQIFNKLALDDGMDVRVLVAYRLMFGTAFLCPLAFFIERKKRPPLTLKMVLGLFLCGFCIAINHNLLVLALKLTNSTTIVTALSNLTPQSTFIVAVLTRQEIVKLGKASGRAKLAGTLVGLGGAMVVTFYPGPEMAFMHRLARVAGLQHGDRHGHDLSRGPAATPSAAARIVGSFLAIAGCFSYTAWLSIQARVGEAFPCHYSIAALVCLAGAAQTALLALCFHRDAAHWRLGLDVRLYSSAYAGFVASGLAFPLMSWCLRERGPLYVAMFGPLIIVFVAVLSSIFLDETLHLGIVLGAVLIVAGLYMVLWGKAREAQEKAAGVQPEDQELGMGKESTAPADATNGETKCDESNCLRPIHPDQASQRGSYRLPHKHTTSLLKERICQPGAIDLKIWQKISQLMSKVILPTTVNLFRSVIAHLPTLLSRGSCISSGR